MLLCIVHGVRVWVLPPTSPSTQHARTPPTHIPSDGRSFSFGLLTVCCTMPGFSFSFFPLFPSPCPILYTQLHVLVCWSFEIPPPPLSVCAFRLGISFFSLCHSSCLGLLLHDATPERLLYAPHDLASNDEHDDVLMHGCFLFLFSLLLFLDTSLLCCLLLSIVGQRDERCPSFMHA